MLLLLFFHALAFGYLSEDLKTYIHLHQIGDQLLADFDREQKNAHSPPLLDSKTYQKLLVVKYLKHEIVHQFENSHPLLPKTIEDPWELAGISDFLESYQAHFPLNNPPVPPLVIFTKNLSKTYLDPNHSSHQKLKVFYKIQALREKWFQKNSTPLEGEKEIQRIEPSPGANGNIIGNQFPEGTWALTYDDGPHPTRTLEIVDLLEKNSIRATFFWLARNANSNTPVVNQVLERSKSGQFSLQNHSFTHANLVKLDDKGLDFEISESNRQLANLYGTRPSFFRCPYGSGLNNSAIRQKIADEKMIHVFWNVDSLDWQDKNPSSIVDRVKTQMNKSKKGIILFHDIHAQTVEATKLLFDSLKNQSHSKDLRWLTLPEIVEELNKK